MNRDSLENFPLRGSRACSSLPVMTEKKKPLVALRFPPLEVDSVTWVQILNEAVCVSNGTNIFRESIYLTILLPSMV